jgi:hypothetical protein
LDAKDDFPIPIFRNEINALGDFRGGVKVARDFAHSPRRVRSAWLAQEAEGCCCSLIKTPDWISERPPRGGEQVRVKLP